MPHDDAFVIGKYGTLCLQYDGYRQIDDPQKCKNAAKVLDKELSVESTDSQPPGCYYDIEHDDVWYNGHDIGSENEYSAPICFLGKMYSIINLFEDRK